MTHSNHGGGHQRPHAGGLVRPPATMRNVFALLALGLLLLAGSAQGASEASKASKASSAPLDLNRATAEQLEGLPGIGSVKAAAILEVRDSRGGFESMDELESVRGIGPALVEKLRPFVVLGKTKPRGGKAGAK